MLRDLRALLVEAKQKVPPFLVQLEEANTDLLEVGGTFGWSMYIFGA